MVQLWDLGLWGIVRIGNGRIVDRWRKGQSRRRLKLIGRWQLCCVTPRLWCTVVNGRWNLSGVIVIVAVKAIWCLIWEGEPSCFIDGYFAVVVVIRRAGGGVWLPYLPVVVFSVERRQVILGFRNWEMMIRNIQIKLQLCLFHNQIVSN